MFSSVYFCIFSAFHSIPILSCKLQLERRLKSEEPHQVQLRNPTWLYRVSTGVKAVLLWIDFANNGGLANLNVAPVQLEHYQLRLFGCDVIPSAKLRNVMERRKNLK